MEKEKEKLKAHRL